MWLFDKLFVSDFKKKINSKSNLFCSWEQKYSKDACQEIFVLTKDKKTINFAEDLREHSIEFQMYDDSVLIIDIGYKEIYKIKSIYNYDILKDNLMNTKNVSEELDLYFEFLEINSLL